MNFIYIYIYNIYSIYIDYKDKYLTNRKWRTWILPSLALVGGLVGIEYYKEQVEIEQAKLKNEPPAIVDPWMVKRTKQSQSK